MNNQHQRAQSSGVSETSALRKLENAIMLGELETVRIWIHQTSNINSKLPNTGFTPLEAAVVRENVAVMQLVLDKGANLEQECSRGMTPLILACNCEFLDGVRLLIERGANLSATDEDRLTCLLVAAKNKNRELVAYLLEQNDCPLNMDVHNGYSALHYIVLLDDPLTTSCLIRKGVDINELNYDEENPVFLATRDNCMRSLQVLLEAGASPDTMTLDGLTAVELALSMVPPREDIIHALLDDYPVAQNVDEQDVRVESAERKLQSLQTELDHCIICPITMEVMKDPVITADGHTYERRAIEQWLGRKRISPLTRQPMSSSALIPNMAMRHLIDKK
eukprot:g6668.t1